ALSRIEGSKRPKKQATTAAAAATAVETLNLSDNRIGNEGIKELCNVLRTNRSLKSLDLSSNRIGDDGALHIAGSFLFLFLPLSLVLPRSFLSWLCLFLFFV